jgi:L-alanine-DL-glutamate epimerase-like enolase superfamily enzyme
MLTESYHIEEGCLILPGKPGLGYELDEKWLAAHSVLHE